VDQLGLALRSAYPQALATLTRLLGGLDPAEEAMQEASIRALRTWRERGIPDSPAAWLVRAARNYAIDAFRRNELQRRHAGSVAQVYQMDAHERSPSEPGDTSFDDDLLRLIFTCCHPALAQEARVALTLKAIAGMSVEEIARAFLVTPAAMEQRLTRVKRYIREARIPYEIPSREELPRRLAAVLAVVYLIFNEGYMAARGTDAMRPELANEAIHLGRILARLFRAEPEVMGLLALMLLQHARMPARVDGSGDLIPLDEQDRSLWNGALIAEGRALTEKALRHRRPGTYQIQAAIAAVHGSARTAQETDWPQISELYRLLEHHLPSPVVTLNRAVAVAKVEGPEAGLDLLRTLANTPAMLRYQHYHAARAALLMDAGRFDEARAAYQRALALTENARERAFLKRRLDRLGEH
jgi:RNA polymerase sigma-70 factor (ECF subfamily)